MHTYIYIYIYIYMLDIWINSSPDELLFALLFV